MQLDLVAPPVLVVRVDLRGQERRALQDHPARAGLLEFLALVVQADPQVLPEQVHQVLVAPLVLRGRQVLLELELAVLPGQVAHQGRQALVFLDHLALPVLVVHPALVARQVQVLLDRLGHQDLQARLGRLE
jgi:hypothetical protein